MKYYYRNNKLSLCNALYHARRQTDAWIRVWAAAFFFCSVFASNRFSAVIFPRILISSVDWNVEFKIIIGSSSISSPIGCRSHGAPFAGTLRRTFCFEMLLALLLLLLVGWLAWHSIAVCALPRYKKCAFILFSALHYYFVFFFSLFNIQPSNAALQMLVECVHTRARAYALSLDCNIEKEFSCWHGCRANGFDLRVCTRLCAMPKNNNNRPCNRNSGSSSLTHTHILPLLVLRQLVCGVAVRNVLQFSYSMPQRQS